MTKKALFILGMHRSGTSALARVVNLLGANLGNDLMAAAADNKKGFFEHEPIVAIHEQLLTELGSHWSDSTPLPKGWQKTKAAKAAQKKLGTIIDKEFAKSDLWALKDPRQCRLMDLWFPLLKKRRIQPHFIIAYRHPQEVAASLEARDGINPESAYEAWLSYTVEALLSALDYPYSIVSYDELMENWQPAMERVGKELSIEWPIKTEEAAKKINSFLSPKLRHHKASKNDLPKPIAACLKQLKKPSRKPLEKLQQAVIERSLPYAETMREARLETYQLMEKLEKTQQQAAAAKHRANDIEGQLAEYRTEAEQRIERAEDESDTLKQNLDLIYNSASWKITEPLRTVKKLVKQGDKG